MAVVNGDMSARHDKGKHPEPPDTSLSEWAGGGGGGLQYEMPRCVCWGSENVPIMKDVLGKNKHTHIE